ncbi:hypothetical protein ACFWZS_29765 [[Kitasatospora] papulosa]|uniref:hypothetical protein n=1 Tax=[Kitasatospora] papulosa TaxID=1464011 RepID=UPI0036A442A5
MAERIQRNPDLDQLLRLIGILGSPIAAGGFWESWRHNEDGYGFKKIKSGVASIARSASNHDYLARDFADYVLMLFATETPEQEDKLADMIGRHITSGHTQAVGAQFLADLRGTAWRVWRDHHEVTAIDAIEQWAQAPFPGEREKWARLQES